MNRRFAVCTCSNCGKKYNSLILATKCCQGKRKQKKSVINLTPTVRKTIQHQLGLFGSGDYCRLGACDMSQNGGICICKK